MSPLTPIKNETKNFRKKGCENFMRNRTIEINIRVDEKEKKKLQRNAKKSGLSLSAYLRKSGLNQEIYEIPNEKLGEVYKLICQIKDNLYKIELERIDKGLAQVKEKFLEVFNPTKDGGNNGDN